ncbi:hypothetical protein M413DRAFT_191080 [Hebeloma cylindrosporum]|uniref:Uncharacterized protein n=1 Tax=Hebeloma cylindrosporum TaxID=76867 RepID=A0A0C3BRV1_HEBCY|nr:hypothetical protein M413DRAFT_191080 [Hebeloma cylindrosporum h7]
MHWIGGSILSFDQRALCRSTHPPQAPFSSSLTSHVRFSLRHICYSLGVIDYNHVVVLDVGGKDALDSPPETASSATHHPSDTAPSSRLASALLITPPTFDPSWTSSPSFAIASSDPSASTATTASVVAGRCGY